MSGHSSQGDPEGAGVLFNRKSVGRTRNRERLKATVICRAGE